MHGLTVALAGLLLAVGATAAPGDALFAKRDCARDNCLRAVVASYTLGGPARGSADCSSFLVKTVTPCPVTSTIISSVTVTSATTTSTLVQSTSSSIVTTIITTSIVSTFAGTVTTTSVVSLLQAPAGPMKKRAACTPTTSSPSNVPAYASACSGTARYSSACSCDGVAERTTTLTPITSTTTSFITFSATATAVTTRSVTSTYTLTATSIQVQTSTSRVTATATVTIQPRSNNFYIRNSLDNGGTGGGSDGSLISKPGANGKAFRLDEQGRLQDPEYGFFIFGRYDNGRGGKVLAYGGEATDDVLHCLLANPATATGRLTCVDNNGYSVFYNCANSFVQITIGPSVPAGCNVLTLTAFQSS